MINRSCSRGFVVAVFAAALVALPLNSASGSAFPANNGKLTFVTATDISSVPAAQAGSVQEVSGAGLHNPAWIGDGSKLAYDNGAVIFVTGSASPFIPGTNPAWSPRGGTIVFQSGTPAEIYRISYPSPQTGEPVNLSNSPTTDDVDPSVSPDGTRIAFARQTGSPPHYQIYTMSATDGLNQTQLTSTGDNRSPSWSPDGSQIAFASNRDGNSQIYTMSAGGGSQTRITNDANTNEDPAWSPDGTVIAFDSGGAVYTVPNTSTAPPYTQWASGTTPDWQDAAPTIDTIPTIFGVTPPTPPSAGDTLTATTGTWKGFPTDYSFQWQRSTDGGTTWNDISGATSQSYTVRDPDDTGPNTQLRVVVTATNNAVGPSPLVSVPVPSLSAGQVAGAAPVNVTPPIVSGTASADLGFLFATPGTWTGVSPITFTYQWLRCFGHTDGHCEPIPGATSSFYDPTGDDIDTQLNVAVIATNSAGKGGASSNATPYVTGTPPRNHVSPTISGGIEVGSTLTTTDGTWFGSQPITFTYQWRICTPDGSDCNSIPGATGKTYVLQPSDYGSTIRIMIRGRNGAGVAFGVSNHTLPILHKTLFGPSVAQAPTIAGPTRAGETLTASPGTWQGEAPITFAYAWQRCDATGAGCKPIGGAKKPTYRLNKNDVGSTIRIAITATNVVNKATVNSDATDTIAAQRLHRKGNRIVGKRGQLVLVGTPRDDVIFAGPGNVTIYGMGGFDQIHAGPGNDVIYLGTGGSSRVWGGPGSNTIYAANGERDTIVCGTGPSRVFADPFDVARKCSVVTTTAPTPAPAPTPTTP
jgi:hypothetical protein